MNAIIESFSVSNRRTAILVGVLYIIGTVAGILSVVFSGAVLNSPDYLIKISTHESQIIIAALFVLTMGLSLAIIPVAMFPVLKKHHEALAVGYVVFRGALETVTYLAMTVSWLLLITISQEYSKTAPPDNLMYRTLGTVVVRGQDSIRSILEIVFPIGALMFYTVLYRSKLIPRWISGWGLAAASLWLTVGLLGVFQLIVPYSTIQLVLSFPIFLQEMVMAFWMIVKGFNEGGQLNGKRVFAL